MTRLLLSSCLVLLVLVTKFLMTDLVCRTCLAMSILEGMRDRFLVSYLLVRVLSLLPNVWLGEHTRNAGELLGSIIIMLIPVFDAWVSAVVRPTVLRLRRLGLQLMTHSTFLQLSCLRFRPRCEPLEGSLKTVLAVE